MTTIRELYKAFELLSLACPSAETERALDRLWADYAAEFEALPVSAESVPRPHMFVLLGGEWVGVTAYEEAPGYPGASKDKPYLRYTTGTDRDAHRVTGLAPFGEWAHCTADDRPCLPDPAWRFPTAYPARGAPAGAAP
jgi:hypothetical protein